MSSARSKWREDEYDFLTVLLHLKNGQNPPSPVLSISPREYRIPWGNKPGFILRKRLWVGARPGNTSSGVTAARGGGEAVPVLLPHAAAAVSTEEEMIYHRLQGDSLYLIDLGWYQSRKFWISNWVAAHGPEDHITNTAWLSEMVTLISRRFPLATGPVLIVLWRVNMSTEGGLWVSNPSCISLVFPVQLHAKVRGVANQWGWIWSEWAGFLGWQNMKVIQCDTKVQWTG